MDIQARNLLGIVAERVILVPSTAHCADTESKLSTTWLEIYEPFGRISSLQEAALDKIPCLEIRTFNYPQLVKILVVYESVIEGSGIAALCEALSCPQEVGRS